MLRVQMAILLDDIISLHSMNFGGSERVPAMAQGVPDVQNHHRTGKPVRSAVRYILMLARITNGRVSLTSCQGPVLRYPDLPIPKCIQGDQVDPGMKHGLGGHENADSTCFTGHASSMYLSQAPTA